MLKFTGNKSLIDALLKEAGIAGAGGSLKDLVSTRPRKRMLTRPVCSRRQTWRMTSWSPPWLGYRRPELPKR
ncbi:MAG: hypothetical protein EOS82_21460 [Mesorhizobium sp.]|nr:MAG: hypothetical protein EOR89_31360 [Mesorhizobium sp.]RWQ46758.1 MAG: hypothetical protein EOS82_21460 [Mesorhizobium sp.]